MNNMVSRGYEAQRLINRRKGGRKLAAWQIKFIRNNKTKTVAEKAKMYGVAEVTVRGILNGHSWKWLKT